MRQILLNIKPETEESTTRDPEITTGDPESEALLNSLTLGDLKAVSFARHGEAEGKKINQ